MGCSRRLEIETLQEITDPDVAKAAAAKSRRSMLALMEGTLASNLPLPSDSVLAAILSWISRSYNMKKIHDQQDILLCLRAIERSRWSTDSSSKMLDLLCRRCKS